MKRLTTILMLAVTLWVIAAVMVGVGPLWAITWQVLSWGA